MAIGSGRLDDSDRDIREVRIHGVVPFNRRPLVPSMPLKISVDLLVGARARQRNAIINGTISAGVADVADGGPLHSITTSYKRQMIFA